VPLIGDGATEWLVEEVWQWRDEGAHWLGVSFRDRLWGDDDAGRWLAARRERRREEEVKALGQGRSDRRRSDIAATSARAHGSVAARRGVAWCDIPPLSKDGQS
jgi:hypothetical protein